jgi:hypothetical protein
MAPGAKFAPRGEICPLGGIVTPLFTPRGEHSLLSGQASSGTEFLRIALWMILRARVPMPEIVKEFTNGLIRF